MSLEAGSWPNGIPGFFASLRITKVLANAEEIRRSEKFWSPHDFQKFTGFQNDKGACANAGQLVGVEVPKSRHRLKIHKLPV
ncbi:MAG TPA: hypothetical protein VJ718_11170 [Candidatus Binataceae bacterium]|jgi:hypothetical protein|nr:hypothetical protein [Candidatus Binataceae bacterium]